MNAGLSDAAWEAMHAPYDGPTYQAVLARLGPQDVVLEIGAGDLRLARRMARVVRRVYAVEIDPAVLARADAVRIPLPLGLIAVCADARSWDVPADVTAGVLLMRHCTCFLLYFEKLQQAGAARLITNARWRMDVEAIDLQAARMPFDSVDMGWYACLCGRTGFKEGPVERWTMELDRIVHEVSNCPQCA